MKAVFRNHLKVMCAAVVLLGWLPLNGAWFMKIEGIEGESTDSSHENEIEIESFSWGASQSSTTVGGGGTGMVNFTPLVVTKRVDKATPKLMESCASGQHIPRAVLTVRKAGEMPVEYLVIQLEDIVVTSYSTSGSAGDDRPTEEVAFYYNKIHVSYFPQKPDGSLDAAVEFGWNLETNTP